MSVKSKPSHLYSSISVAIVMFLVGIFVLITLHAHSLTNIIKEKMNIVVELNDIYEKDKLIANISKNKAIRENSIKFVGRDEATSIMTNNLDLQFSEDENPFSDVITFNIKSSAYSESTLKKIKTELEQVEGVRSVFYEDLTIANIKNNLNKVAYIIFFIGLLFVFLAIVIIKNTINLSMYADRWEIKTMELVGAKWNFIKMPYIKTSVLVGFRAFIMATILILALIILCQFYLPQIWEIINFIYVLVALLVIFILSITIPAITTNAASNMYLNKHISKLFE